MPTSPIYRPLVIGHRTGYFISVSRRGSFDAMASLDGRLPVHNPSHCSDMLIAFVMCEGKRKHGNGDLCLSDRDWTSSPVGVTLTSEVLEG
jgi:hypothetical protein